MYWYLRAISEKLTLKVEIYNCLNMRIILIFIGYLGCVALGFSASAALENEAILMAVRDYGIWIAVVALGCLSALGLTLFLAYVLLRSKIRRLLKADGVMTETEMANGLIDLVTTPIGVTNPTPRDRQRAAVVNFSTWLMRRETTQFYFNVTVTVMGGLIGSATLLLLYEQNQKIDEQNRRITLQTDANVTQSVLLEGARRSSNAQELNSLLLDIRAGREVIISECSEEKKSACFKWMHENDARRLFIPDELFQRRIKAFAQRSTPYFTVTPKDRTVEFDERLNSQLDLPFQSPERGRLLEELVRNEFQVTDIDFSYAELDGAELPYAYMPRANLSWATLQDADFQEAHIPDANLRNSDLSRANFSGSFALKARFDGATLETTNFSNSQLPDATMTDGKMGSVIFKSANLMGTRFNRSDLKNSDFRSSNLMGADFRNTNLSGSAFGWSNISEADFRDAQQADIQLNAAWAWEDWPPVGLAPGMQFRLCRYQAGAQRTQKPNDELCRNVIVAPVE